MSLFVQHTPPVTLIQGDAIDVLSQMDAESIDLIVTDPAYESLEKHRARGTTTRLKQSKSSSNQWFPIFPNERFPELFRAMFRVLKKHTHLYMHTDAETMFFVKPIAERAGFKFWKPLVWDKQAMGMGYHYRAQHEFILFFEKGKRKIHDLSIPDVLSVKRVRGGFPTEKPVELERILVAQSSSPGELVCDPFMGSASAGEAALSLSREFFGIDISLEAHGIAKARLGGPWPKQTTTPSGATSKEHARANPET